MLIIVVEVKIFNIMSRVNEIRFLVQHESFRCNSRLNANVFNSKQKWNYGKC